MTARVPAFLAALLFWFGLYVPAGTPSAAASRLHEAAVKGLAKPEVRDRIAHQGMDPTLSKVE